MFEKKELEKERKIKNSWFDWLITNIINSIN